MVVFLADRTNLQTKRLHDRIKNRIQDDFENVRRRRAEPREPGAYRIVGEYPTENARVEIGFRLRTDDPYEHYWINRIEPDSGLLVGWHQDDTHDELGPVHLQLDYESETIDRVSASFIDSHPLDVVGRRLSSLEDTVSDVEWQDGAPTGFRSR
jgi:hypothetical protein